MRQIECSHNNTKKITWTDEHELLKVGNYVSFKGEEGEWKIDYVFDPSLEKSEIKRCWHVGGL